MKGSMGPLAECVSMPVRWLTASRPAPAFSFQPAANAHGVSSTIKNREDSDHIARDTVVDGERKSSREKPVMAEMDRVDPSVNVE